MFGVAQCNIGIVLHIGVEYEIGLPPLLYLGEHVICDILQ